MAFSLEDHLFVEAKERAAAQTVEKETNGQKAGRIKDRLFALQRDFVDDPARRKALLCPRRAGKSFTASTMLVAKCLEMPYANCLYVTLTRSSGRSILWSPPQTGLKWLDQEYGLRLGFHNTDLRAHFPNNSLISLVGGESKADIDRFRGQAYDLVVIDEAKSFPPMVLEELVKEVFGPALNDRLGTLAIVGTPGSILAGPFYEATRPGSDISRPWAYRDRPEWKDRPYVWSAHTWTVSDNVGKPHLWEACLEDKAAFGWSDSNPIWRREYLGEWVADASNLVFMYEQDAATSGKNDWEPDPNSDNPFGLPAGHEWLYLCGMDLGFDDDFALVVGAYSETCPEFYHVYTYKQPQLTVSDVAAKFREVEEVFGTFEAVVGDRGGLGKMIFAELSDKYGIEIEAAEKTEKKTYIELINSDLHEGRIKIIPDSELAFEMQLAQWDEYRRNIDKNCADHAIDAFVYLWRYSYHHFHRERTLKPEPGTREYANMVAEEERRAAMARKKKERELMGSFEDHLWENFRMGEVEEDSDWFEEIEAF